MTDTHSAGTRGFTLMEILVVLVIIGLITAVAIPQVARLLESARHKTARLQIETVGQAVGYYQMDLGQFPSTQQGLGALLKATQANDDWAGPYARNAQQLTDPWGRPLIYQMPGKNGKFDLMTLGADGKEGGSGDDKDIAYGH